MSANKNATFEYLTSENLKEKTLIELSNFYRYIFNNEHGHYLFGGICTL